MSARSGLLILAALLAAGVPPRAAGQALSVRRLSEGGEERAAPADPLAPTIARFRAERVPLAAAFLAVGRGYGLAFALDPGVKGEASLDLADVTVRELIDALAASQGLHWERRGRVVRVRSEVLRCYDIDYPQMTRSAQGASSVMLSAQAAAPLSAAGAPPPVAAPSGTPSQDQTSLSIQEQNQTTFWADIQAELAALARPGESVAVNKLAGLALVSCPPPRQDDFKAAIDAVNRRISRQVRISARVLEVELDATRQLGVDWSLAAAEAGGLSLSGWSTSTGIAALGGQPLGAPAVTGTLATGKISAVISALREQGEVRAVSNPSVVSLSNQAAFVKVGTEQTFFSRTSSTTVSQTGLGTPAETTQSAYAQNAITIGTVLYVTPEVNGDGTVTVDVVPAVTQLVGTDASPDGQQTAPRMDIKSLSTLARLHPGQSIMIGGLIREQTARLARKVPVLGDLPLVGRAFGTTADSSTRSELVIFLTAEVLP